MVLDREDFERVDALLQAALDLPAGERAGFLDGACAGDAALRERVSELIRLAELEGDLLTPGGAFVAHAASGDAAEIASAKSPATRLTRVMEGAPLSPGQKLGRYEVRELLGSGGMGRVYRALDPALGREVAIKALSRAFGGDGAALRRFEREARLLATLSHPNVAAIHGFELLDGVPYLILERIEGETLAQRLRRRLEMRDALSIAVQITEGLAEAHAKGVVHRDLKPSNVMLTAGGRVKLVDFGLAKTAAHPPSGDSSEPLTATGTVLGTAPYMSPEQIRGEPVDTRTDVWAFGCLLYEMLSGKHAFQGRSAPEVLAAALRDEPDWSALPPAVAPPVRRLLERSLRKDPDRRLQHIGDARLELLDAGSEGTAVASSPPGRRRGGRVALVAAGLLAALLPAAFVAGRRSSRSEPPRFAKLTYRRGYIRGARFTPDGRSIVYSAAWDGGPMRVYQKQAESPDSLTLELPGADLLAISETGELAVALDCKGTHLGVCSGTLARSSLTGGAPRELAEDVQQADWLKGGGLVVVRHRHNGATLELRPGKTLYDTAGHVSFPRVSPGGDLVAFFDHPHTGDDRGSVAVIDLEGKKKRQLTGEWGSARGLAWSPSGDEIWFTAAEGGSTRALYAVTPAGKLRTVHRSPGALTLQDVSRDGRVLMTREEQTYGILALAPGESVERELSWLDHSVLTDVSEDGRTVLLSEQSEAVGPDYAACVRKLDGSPVVRLSKGWGLSITPDGQRVLAKLPAASAPIWVVPVGTGETLTLRPPVAEIHWAVWFPDGHRILLIGNDAGRPVRLYAGDVQGNSWKPITPEGAVGSSVTISPDGRFAATASDGGTITLYPVDGGTPVPLAGALPGDRPVRYTRDAFYVTTAQRLPRRIFRIDPTTGARSHFRDILPADRAGVSEVWGIGLSGDARGHAYTYHRWLSELFAVDGLR